ncbi:MAG: pyridoxamine 5'-phosphate oxidase family protein [Chloroflexi bacterium]|nr:pyridoxamine 5'-phosphate oxidase family protein [Chloroflexota bacterium]
MGERYPAITEKIQAFIERQHVFFVATAAAEGRINLSPKGMDTLRVLDPSTVAWLNLTGSGNETAAHLREHARMTLMFCSFERAPLIVRLYGAAVAYHPRDAEWNELIDLFPPLPGARQCIRMRVDLVQTSCGFGAPLFEYVGEREALRKWAEAKGEDGIELWWREENMTSLDGKPTGILSD